MECGLSSVENGREQDFNVPVMKHAGGRPSKFTQELADRICSQLSEGMSLRSVCLAEDMPSTVTVFSWMRTNEEFLSQYARAKQESADAMAEEILDISDDGSNDWMEKKYGDAEFWVTNGEALQRSRLRVDTRKWLMAKMKPKKYGEKLDLSTNGKDLPTPILGYVPSNNSNQEDSSPHEAD